MWHRRYQCAPKSRKRSTPTGRVRVF
jgi:hypothetical protein